jgi:hypothetical protein
LTLGYLLTVVFVVVVFCATFISFAYILAPKVTYSGWARRRRNSCSLSSVSQETKLDAQALTVVETVGVLEVFSVVVVVVIEGTLYVMLKSPPK